MYAIKRLFLGVFLIALASGILLASDLGHRKGKESNASSSGHIPHIALFVFTTSTLLDDGAKGVLDVFEEEGIIDGQTAKIDHFNAEGDMPTANSIAKRITGEGYDIVVTLSTPTLQTMASANKEGQVRHIFGAVTDPFASGVGINPADPLEHPPHLAGIGTFQPVDITLQLMHYLAPHIKTLGIVWNPSEACSEACTLKAKKTASNLGLTIIEAQVDNTAGVFEAATSLAARGADAFYVGGDNTVETGIESLIKAASAAGIGVITNTPNDALKGAALNLGANYYEVGRQVGQMAAEVLQDGLDPATVAIKDVVPRKLALNTAALEKLATPWAIPPDIMDCVALTVDEKGPHDYTETAKVLPDFKDGKPVSPAMPAESASAPQPAATAPSQEEVVPISAPLGKKWRLRFIDYCEAEHVSGCHQGFSERIKALGLVEGRDYELAVQNAQGDIAAMNTMITAIAAEKPDMVLLTSTPTLQAAVQNIKDIPVLFSNVANPIIVGAGVSDTDHLPNITGIYSEHDCAAMVKLIKECLPQAHTIGTLYCPAEANSEYNSQKLGDATQADGLAFIRISDANASEVPQSAQALLERGVDVICQVVDNLHDTGFTSIVEAARRSKTPLFSFVPGLVREHGAAISLAKDYNSSGEDLADLVLRVMRGEHPEDIPFHSIRRTKLVVNLENARLCGLETPQSVISRADEVIGGAAQ